MTELVRSGIDGGITGSIDTVRTAHFYRHDGLDRKVSEEKTGEMFEGYSHNGKSGLVTDYAYNGRGELASAKTRSRLRHSQFHRKREMSISPFPVC